MSVFKRQQSRPSVKQLLALSTRIACLPGNGSSLSRITIDKRNFENTIGEFLRSHPDLGSLPIEITSVLGSDDQYRRQLHTDWLIQYLQCRGNKEKSVKEWISHWNTNEKLKFVSSHLPVKSRRRGKEMDIGVYIWPKPLIDRDEFDNRTLRWVIYVVVPEKPDEDDKWLDIFTAGASSKIVTFEKSDKERIMKSTEAIVGYTLTEGNFINMWASRSMKSSMDIFLDKFEDKPMKHKQLKGVYENTPVTLNNLASFLESIAEKVNGYNISRDEDKLVVAANDNQHSSGGESIKSKRLDTVSESERTPNLEETLSQNSDQNSYTSSQSSQEEPPDNNNNLIPISLTPDDIGSSVSADIDTWIKQTMTLTNIYKLQDNFSQLRNSARLEEIHDDIIILQNHIDSLNQNFQNMYDNYVCFDGEVDRGQLEKFMAACYQHSISSWNLSRVSYPSIVSWKHFENAYNKLCFLYYEENKRIVSHETRLAQQICINLVEAYKLKMKSYVGQNINDTLGSREFNNRVIKYCIGVIGRSQDYHGKLNNVVRTQIEIFGASLDQIYEQLTSPLQEKVEIKIPGREDIITWYITEIQQAFYCQDYFDPNNIKQTHEVLVNKLTEKMGAKDKAEFKLQLDSLFINMVENELVREEAEYIVSRKNRVPNTLTFFITNKFIYSYCSLKGSWTNLIPFNILTPSPNETFRGHFETKVGITKESGAILFGNDLVNRKASEFRHVRRFLDYFKKQDISKETVKAVVIQVLLKYKTVLENSLGRNFSQVNLLVSSWLSFEDRLLIRESCKKIGFKKTCILMESSIAAYKLLNEGLALSLREYLVLVVVASKNEARMEIYGKHHSSFSQEQEAESVKLLAVSCNEWLPTDHAPKETSFINTIKATYTQALSQLTDHQRNSVIKYVSILERSRWNPVLDSYLQNVEKIGKAEDLNAESLLPIVDQFANRKHVLENFLHGLCKP